MKKLLILIMILLLNGFVIGLDFGLSFSMRSANDNKFLFDYQFSSEIAIKDRLNAEFEMERENGKHYLNYITELHQKGSFYAVSTKRTFIQCRSIDRICLEALGRISVEQKRYNLWIIKFISNGWWNCGLRQEWNSNIPTTNIIIGKSYSKELNFFLMPFKYEYSLFYFSDDFKKWLNESSCKVSFSLLANVDFFLKYLLKENWFQLKVGLKIKL